MRTIEFTESELSDMLSFYRQERDKALKKIAEIESILSLPHPSKPPPPTRAAGRPKTEKADPSPAEAPLEALAAAPEPGNGSPAVTERKKRKTGAPRRKKEKAPETEVDPEENGVNASGNVTHLNGKWVRFIAELLEKQGRVIAADDIVSEAIYRYDIADEKHQTTRQVIYNTLYKLDSTKRMIGSCTIPGRKGKRYGLKKWFTPDGEIKAPFLAKAT
jgi:hypothetical protein